MENAKADPSEKLILIVDDDETVLDFLKFAVEHEGFRTIMAADGNAAIEKVKECSPDLVILDMMIPKKGGFEVIKALQTAEYSRLPIIVVTGRFVDDNFKQMVQFESNVKDYIIKPVKSPFLLYKIHSLLGTQSKDHGTVEEKKKMLDEKLKPNGSLY